MRISSSLGCGLAASSAVAEMSIPGVQNPHWTPPSGDDVALQRVRLSGGAETLHGRDLASVGLARPDRSTSSPAPIDEHHAADRPPRVVTAEVVPRTDSRGAGRTAVRLVDGRPVNS